MSSSPKPHQWATVTVNTLYVLSCLAALSMAFVFGDMSAGARGNILLYFACLLFFGPALVFWGIAALMDVATRRHMWHFVWTLVMIVPCLEQPWSPKVAFAKRLDSVVGKTTEEAMRIMAPYQGGRLTTANVTESEEYVGPELTYRWSDDACCNADVGSVFVEEGIVTRVSFHHD